MDLQQNGLNTDQVLIGIWSVLAPLGVGALVVFVSNASIRPALFAAAGCLCLVAYRRFVFRHEARIPNELSITRARGILLGVALFVITLQVLVFAAALTWAGFDIASVRFHFAKLDQSEAQLLALMVVSSIFVAPVAEELLFRGLVFRYLSSKFHFIYATAIQAILFAAIHFIWADPTFSRFTQLFVNACFLALLFHYSGSLLVCILAHSLLNAVSYLSGMFVPSVVLGSSDMHSGYVTMLTPTVRLFESMAMTILCVLLLRYGSRTFANQKELLSNL